MRSTFRARHVSPRSGSFRTTERERLRLPELSARIRLNFMHIPIELGANVSFVEPAAAAYPAIRSASKGRRHGGEASLLEENARKALHSEDDAPHIPRLNTKVLETWINETLKEVEASALPRHLLTDESKTPLARFGVDREKLSVFACGIMRSRTWG